jgi:hypothetical protein
MTIRGRIRKELCSRLQDRLDGAVNSQVGLEMRRRTVIFPFARGSRSNGPLVSLIRMHRQEVARRKGWA